MKRRIEITIERERLVFASHKAVSIRAGCSECEMSTIFVLPERAAEMSGMSLRAIFRAIEEGQIHALEAGENMLLVCACSLEQLSNSQTL